MRALLVYQSEQLPSSRIRIAQMVPHLKAEGVQAEAVPYPADSAGHRALRRRMNACDVVVLQKKMPRGLQRGLWKRAPVPLVYDFDDAVMHEDVEPWTSPRRQRRFERTIALCDGVIAGNDYLASQVKGVEVLVAPSPVPDEVPRASEREPNAVGRLGWIGGKKNLISLKRIGSALRAVAERMEFILMVVSDGPFALEGVEVEYFRWSLSQQDRLVAEMDVGLMPLEDTPWHRGKCAYKALQYLAAEVPCIASPVGMNRQVIEPEVNGLLAADDSQWEAAIERLLADADERRRMGAAGRERVLAEYTYAEQARRWAKFLRKIAGTD